MIPNAQMSCARDGPDGDARRSSGGAYGSDADGKGGVGRGIGSLVWRVGKGDDFRGARCRWVGRVRCLPIGAGMLGMISLIFLAM